MELSIKTDKLKEMMAKAVKGASNNKLIPLTSFICIELKSGVLTFTTTDATNYLYVRESGVEGNDFYVVVGVDILAKLVAKMTCDSVKFELKEKSLKVTGNGTYNIQLPLNEEGELIKYPNPLQDVEFEGEGNEILLSTVRTILNTIKPALATTLENPCYTGYYIGDDVIATDSYKVASISLKLLDEPKLISPEMMDLLAVMTAEKIKVDIKDNILVFSTPDVVVYGTELEGIEDFPVEVICNFLDAEFPSVCKINKTALLQVLDRLSLFVGQYDKNGINLTFTSEGLQVSSKTSTGVELIKYTEVENFSDYTCLIDVLMFVSQLKGYAGDVVTIHYGGDNVAIKLTDGNITQVIALLANE